MPVRTKAYLQPFGKRSRAAGASPDWPYNYTGFAAHWNKNTNLAWAFDVWFLNLFPRESPFRFNSGGWSTLSFIPTLATMQLGLWTGRWLQTDRSTQEKLKGLIAGGIALTIAGLLFQWLGICPIVKRIWTSSYTLYSGGLVVLILAGFYALLDWQAVLQHGNATSRERVQFFPRTPASLCYWTLRARSHPV